MEFGTHNIMIMIKLASDRADQTYIRRYALVSRGVVFHSIYIYIFIVYHIVKNCLHICGGNKIVKRCVVWCFVSVFVCVCSLHNFVFIFQSVYIYISL